MVRAKNLETVSKFVKVMPRILWLLFSAHSVYPFLRFLLCLKWLKTDSLIFVEVKIRV